MSQTTRSRSKYSKIIVWVAVAIFALIFRQSFIDFMDGFMTGWREVSR